ncbi:MAG: ThiF family adenylyltransferase, partial [Alphaproteobacteria bacterium]
MTIDDTRFAALLPPSIRSLPVTIIGCGGTGAAFARQLAYTGFTHLTLIDFDTIEPHNLGPQGWSAAQLGLLKVEALASELRIARPSISITYHARRWSAAHDLRSCTPIVCSCVDSRDTDAFIASKLIPHLENRPDPYLYLSPRVRAIDYVLRSIFDAPSYASYLSAHFPDSAVPPEPGSCGVPTTLYGNTALACLMLDNIRRRFTGFPVITYAQRSFHTPPACWLHEEADQDTLRSPVTVTPPT